MTSSSGSTRAPQVIVLAAGQGKRMYSALPKVLHKLCGRTLLERTLLACQALQPAAVVTVVGHGAERVQAELERLVAQRQWAADVFLTAVQDQQHGTGHATRCALPLLQPDDSVVLIVPGDIPLLSGQILQNFLDAHVHSNSQLSLLTCMHPTGADFGRVIRSSSGDVLAVREQRDCSPEEHEIREINSSVYATTTSFLRRALPKLQPQNAQGEYYLTDVVEYAVSEGVTVNAWVHDDFSELAGANNRAELAELERHQRSRINHRFMCSGVTLQDPATAYIDEDVEIGSDTVIGPNTKITGRSRIGCATTIEGNSCIHDSVIEGSVTLKSFSVVEQAVVGSGCIVGPFARLRPGSRLDANVHVGNFVEIKNSHLCEGVKANHLSYLGDAEVGTKTNIGAGTITCNYDGKKKHRTEIGANCFIGTNSSLVAPLTVEADAYVAAGSTISKSVPSGSLAVARAEQKNVDGWVARKRNRD